jgi:hypothetical protein
LPTLAMSPVCAPLTEFIEIGGVFILISGNDLERSILRIQDGLPPNCFNRVLVAANGGADLVGFIDGKAVPIDNYRFSVRHEFKVNVTLDIVYIGDDGSPSGNDMAAFQEVGPERSILVASEFKSDYNVAFKSSHVGGLLQGTKDFVAKAVSKAKQNPLQPLF